MEIFVLTTNAFQPLTAVKKNLVLDATVKLHPCNRLSIRLKIDLKLVQPSVLIRVCTLSASGVQSSTIILEKRVVENCFDVIALTLHR